MKKFVFLLATGFFFCIMVFISGCEEPDPIVISSEPTINASSNLPSVSYNESCIVTLTVTNTTIITSDFPEFDNINVNGESKSINLTTLPLKENVTYHFLAHGKNGKVAVANVTINVNPPVDPTLFVSVDKSTIERGDSVTITWNSSADSTSSTDFPEVKGKSGSITIFPLETKEYLFVSKNYGRVASVYVTVTVTDPPPPPTPDEELLCNYGPWKMIKLEFMNGPGLPWYEGDIWDCDKDNLYYFYLTPTKRMVGDRGEIPCSVGEVRISEGPWSLIGNMLNTGDPNHLNEIIVLNQDTLVMVYHSGQTSTRETFIHP